jgi:hypothetical protein
MGDVRTPVIGGNQSDFTSTGRSDQICNYALDWFEYSAVRQPAVSPPQIGRPQRKTSPNVSLSGKTIEIAS